MHARYLLLILILAISQPSFGFFSLNSSASFGIYRDDQQNTHTPMVYSFSYSGLYSGGVEAALDVFLNNDFFVNQWQVNASQASVTVPFGNYRTRAQLGRQLFLEGFDILLLDGLQLPYYWSRNGGVWLYGGTTHVLDLQDSTSSTIVGASVFQDVLDFYLRAGYANKYAYGSVTRAFDSLPLSPQILSKQEWSQEANTWSQSFNEVQLSFFDNLNLSAAHSLRNPKKLTSNVNNFVYYVLAQSAQEMEQLSAKYDFSDDVVFQALSRWLRYKTGTDMQMAYQQELSVTWMINPTNSITPVLGHILGYGGELWDTGLQFKNQISEKATLNNELSAAYMNKVNNIQGWAYELRSGLDYHVGGRWMTSAWIEAERNHLFVFDARILANVTYFN